MTRIVAAIFLVVLLLESVPVSISGTAGCSMPCCKRAGRAACCPRHATHPPGGSADAACRLVACDPEARETTTPILHSPVILAGRCAILHSQPGGLAAAPRAGRRLGRARKPPTPPPRFLLV